jgi:hypothetical protein
VHKFLSFCGFWWQLRRSPANYAVILNRNKEFAQLKWPMTIGEHHFPRSVVLMTKPAAVELNQLGYRKRVCGCY